jgi:hypothetical protein
VNKIGDDLQQHFADQLHQLPIGAADTMTRVDIPIDEAARRLLSVLMSETVIGSHSFRIDEADFLRVCSSSYREVASLTRQAKAGRRKAAAK